jgi:DNA-binding transcriptional ArsR family regulator
MPHPPLSQGALALVAARFRALGDPTRLRIVDLLLEGEQSVQELCEQGGLEQPTVSKHLALLLREGIVARRPEGRQAFYRVSDATVPQLCDIVCRGVASRLAGQLSSLPRGGPGRIRPAARGAGRR